MSRVEENRELLEAMKKSDVPDDTFKNTVLADISKSLAVIADNTGKMETLGELSVGILTVNDALDELDGKPEDMNHETD